MNWVVRIAEAVDWRPLGLTVAWHEIEERLGSPLPADFKQFCEAFGRGGFCDELFVDSTDGGATLDALDGLANLRRLAESFPYARLDTYELYVAGGSGVIPWGHVAAGHSFYWLAGQDDPDEWPIMMCVETGEWERFDVSMSEFVFRMLTEKGFAYIARPIEEPYYRLAEGQW
jgi:hypothetical protein